MPLLIRQIQLFNQQNMYYELTFQRKLQKKFCKY